MNIHFLKKGSLNLLQLPSLVIPPIYRYIGVKVGWKTNCEFLGYPKTYEYPKKFIKVIKTNEIYLGSIDMSKNAIELGDMPYRCYRSNWWVCLYNIRSTVCPLYNHIAIKNIDGSIAYKLKELGESLRHLLDTAQIRSTSYDWDYTISFEENCRNILNGED